MKCNDPEDLKTGCNLNKTIRITIGIFYIKALFTDFISNNKCESNRQYFYKNAKIMWQKIKCCAIQTDLFD